MTFCGCLYRRLTIRIGSKMPSAGPSHPHAVPVPRLTHVSTRQAWKIDTVSNMKNVPMMAAVAGFLMLHEVQSCEGAVARVSILNRVCSYRVVRHETHNLLVVAIGVVPARSWCVRPYPLIDDQRNTAKMY